MKIKNCHPKIEDGIDLRLFPLLFLRFFSCSYFGLSQRRRMQPIIYHKVVVNRTYSTINLQIKGFNPYK